MSITDQTKQLRQQMIANDQNAVNKAQQSPTYTNPQIQKLETDLLDIQEKNAPKKEQLVELTTQETKPEVNYRENLINEMAKKDTTTEPMDIETNTEIAKTESEIPVTDVTARLDLTPEVITRARQMAQEAGNQAQSNEYQLTSGATENNPNPSFRLDELDTSKTFSSKYPDGYQFNAGKDGYGGQCAWYAEQITKLPDGSNWTIGDTVAQKKQKLAQHVANGDAFELGGGVPEVGNSIVFNGGKFGHVAVISKINDDGTAVLDESNWNNDKKVTKSRVVSLNDPSILGFIKTVAK